MLRERVPVEKRVDEGGNYFAAPKLDLDFIPTGCKVLDLALGGGWVEDRISNIVGDKATSKTLLCVEAAANFAYKYKSGRILYRECEAAFDPRYAEALGMPTNRVEFGDNPFETVEDVFEDLMQVVERHERTLYIVDSLDSLSDRAELERDVDEDTYGTGKAKMLSQMFRRLVRKMSASHLTLMVVSQVRSNIGVSFGRQTVRSGGRALDFYASQVLYLSNLGRIERTVKGVTRPVGIDVLAKVDKNKVSLPFREAKFSVSFGYGIDDLNACLEWLKSVKSLGEVGVPETDIKGAVRKMMALPDKEYFDKMDEIHRVVENRWYEIEKSFMPSRRKYA